MKKLLYIMLALLLISTFNNLSYPFYRMGEQNHRFVYREKNQPERALLER